MRQLTDVRPGEVQWHEVPDVSVRHPDDEHYGHCSSIAVSFDPGSTSPLLEMYTRGIIFHTSRADARRFLPDVLELLDTTNFDPLAIPTTMVDWHDAPTRARTCHHTLRPPLQHDSAAVSALDQVAARAHRIPHATEALAVGVAGC